MGSNVQERSCLQESSKDEEKFVSYLVVRGYKVVRTSQFDFENNSYVIKTCFQNPCKIDYPCDTITIRPPVTIKYDERCDGTREEIYSSQYVRKY